MALAKQFLKSKPVCKVTFELSGDTFTGKEVAVVGEFNQWSPTETLLKKQKSGGYKTTVELPVGQEIQFRYLIDGTTWINDDAADKYVPSGVSVDQNSVVVL
ncbi:glycoside hydrolase [Emticicia sp. CRIBPO]|jgi:1,4-alpha-glucan branching enzyme|uniref:isoamylase early set domain-containing protein n=1 Tax=Emticicia sp. CRIBPO TaxID=2683258 RepID=UPI001412BCC6|nr:isoamylase early set domain-containing protein [Emticicia sp. CRIBPO]NBA87139.1 glycoside hydrolase [Emticicia sp. CRIBPO]